MGNPEKDVQGEEACAPQAGSNPPQEWRTSLLVPTTKIKYFEGSIYGPFPFQLLYSSFTLDYIFFNILE